MGFLKDMNANVSDIEALVVAYVGKRPNNIRFFRPSMVWLDFLSHEEVIEFLQLASESDKSTFIVIEKRMEVLGSPPRETWIRFIGVPLHVCREETFSLLGDCVGSTIEMNSTMIQKEMLLFGRVKSG